ncbi:hypothetical protein DM860_000660 [Cuscuta australis]|uniref:Uncharacterized protein n=1 Tax=Cuscuta australis TaxID=267555 RepID=A0A328CXS9_9ASTE|nr:hypothetical protein DM860_000660 [Cuscuta australis]
MRVAREDPVAKRVATSPPSKDVLEDQATLSQTDSLSQYNETEFLSTCASNRNRRGTSLLVEKIQQNNSPKKSTEVNISEEDSHEEEEEEGDDIEEYTRIIKGNAIETCVEDEILGSSSKSNMRDLAEEMPADEMPVGYRVYYNEGDGGMYINTPGQTQPVRISNIIYPHPLKPRKNHHHCHEKHAVS